MVTVAFVSFMVGAIVASLYGYQTSTQIGPPAVVYPEAVPVVPPVGGVSLNGTVTGSYAVDGFLCKNCKFKDVHFIYGGGAFRFENAEVSGAVQYTLTGAAANTVVFLSALGLGVCPLAAPRPMPANPNAPIIHNASLKVPLRGDIISPFGQK